MRFYRGQRIVCINDDFKWARRRYAGWGLTYPRRGRVYVMRDYVYEGKPPAIVLEEIANVAVPYNDGVMREAGFLDTRFRPVTDIGDLQALLNRRTMPRNKRTPHWDINRVTEDEEA